MARKNNIDDAIQYYLSVVNFRSKEIFSDFFVKGYRCTQLNSVMQEHSEYVLNAKIYLGMLITLIDDLADNPICFNPRLLNVLYKNQALDNVNFSDHDAQIVNLKDYLFNNIYDNIQKLPHCQALLEIFNFDLEKLYLSNRFSELMTLNNFLCNDYEMKLYGSYTMGVLPAGMIDLMSVKNINFNEIGFCREVFIIAQRLAKIANNISTFNREKMQGDVTNEIMYLSNVDGNDFSFHKNKLEKEFFNGIKLIQNAKNKIISFNVLDYARGIEELFALNMASIGII